MSIKANQIRAYPGRYYTEQDEVSGWYYTEEMSPCGEAEFHRWV